MNNLAHCEQLSPFIGIITTTTTINLRYKGDSPLSIILLVAQEPCTMALTMST
jgi:hypothetical protein